MSKITIKREYISLKTKALIGAGLGLLTLCAGLYAGVLYTVYQYETPRVEEVAHIQLEVPAINDNVLMSGDVPGPNADLFAHSPTGNVQMAEAAFEWKYDSLEEEVDCMAKNIYFEARNEDFEGQVSVGLVTITRVKSEDYPNTVCDVVWQKRRSPTSGKMVAQFSWTWDGKMDEPKNKTSWDNSVRLAQAMLAGGSLDTFHDFLDGADHYHATYVNPSWSKRLEQVAQIGTHIFYRQPLAVTVATKM